MTDLTDALPFWEGFSISSLEVLDEVVQVTLEPHAEAVLACSGCGHNCAHVHEWRWRQIRELPMLGRAVRLKVRLRRVRCSECGPRTERVSWLGRHARITNRLTEFAALWCDRLPIAQVCELTGLHWETVRRIDRARLQDKVDALPLPEPTRLVMDEFALYKGHRYATVVLDADTRRVLWIGEGRSRQAIRPFFEWLGKERCGKIEAVAMDMNTAFDPEVQLHCPKARVVYELFHVIAKYGREVIDRVRVDEANRLKQDRPQRKVIKQARWLLLRNQENLQADGKIRLQELLNANQALMTVYVMKAALKDLWKPVEGKAWRHVWRT